MNELSNKYQSNMGISTCPVCGSIDSLEIVGTSSEDFMLYYEFTKCRNCKRELTFKYDLTSIVEETGMVED